MTNTPDKKKKRVSNAQAFAKYMGMAGQMAAIIIVFVLLGKKGDEYFANETPVITLIAVIIGTICAFYLTLKDFIIKQ